jgi:hypothetical protein
MSADFDFAYLFFFLPLVISAVGLWLCARWLRQHKAPAHWLPVLIVNGVFVSLLLGLLFAGVESYYRFIYDTTDSLSLTKTSQRWFARYFRRNTAGWRDNVEYAPAIESGKARISFVGDAFTIGHGIRNVDDRFANRIRAAHPDWEVHVLAELDLDTGGEIRLIKKLGQGGYQFDRVVLVYNLNDMADMFPKEWPEAMERVAADARQDGWVCRNSYFVNAMCHRIEAKNPVLTRYLDHIREGYRGPLWEVQKQRLVALRRLVEARAGRLLVVTIPFLHATGGRRNDFEAVHQQLDAFWCEQNVPHLDLLPVFRDLPPSKITVNRYDPHPNEYAHRLAAEKIEAFLKEQVR